MTPKPKNRAQCLKCKDIIESKHRHDFKWCKCHAIAVDGGDAYLKRCGDLANCKELPYDTDLPS